MTVTSVYDIFFHSEEEYWQEHAESSTSLSGPGVRHRLDEPRSDTGSPPQIILIILCPPHTIRWERSGPEDLDKK